MLTKDHAEQALRAAQMVAEDFMVTATVLLEAEWVLRSSYRWSAEDRAAGISLLVDLPHAVETPPLVRWAIQRMRAGADFADMLHLATASNASQFATFDRAVARNVGADPPVPVETLD